MGKLHAKGSALVWIFRKRKALADKGSSTWHLSFLISMAYLEDTRRASATWALSSTDS